MLHLIISSGLFDRLSIVQLNNARTVSIDSMQQVLDAYPGTRAVQYTSVPAALQDMLAAFGTGISSERIYIAGSLYLAGEVKAILQ